MKEFHGRVIIPGDYNGQALVSHTGFNIYSSFMDSLINKKYPALCADVNNKELYGKKITGQIICVPLAIGSTTAGMVMHGAAAADIEPKAFLFARTADSLSTAGVLIADIWEKKSIIMVDGLGDEFLDTVKDGDTVDITSDGTVRVS